ncbi:MAG: phosphoribosyltransferase family protein [Haloarculaceae archaeon]
MFQDRADAGDQLADLLQTERVEVDVVLGIPRGALPLGRVVADRLDRPLDVVVASKIGAPHNPELAIGAAASDGSVWLNDDIVASVGADDEYVDREAEREAANAREKLERYRGDPEPPDLQGKSVLLVDDGVATGATMRACIRQAKAAGAERVLVAVPVGPPDSLSDLESEADAVYAVDRPQPFRAVGAHYRSFPQVTDEEAMTYLDRD